MTERVEIIGLKGVPIVQPGDNLAAVVISAMVESGLHPEHGDVLVVAQKIVSKAEGRFVDVETVTPSPEAIKLAQETKKDPRFVEIVLSESRRIVRHRENLIIAEHRLGFVMANAGIDHSNVGPDDGIERVLLLPVDPDRSATILRDQLIEAYSAPVAVIISDSFGRPWRRGTVGVAIGAAGLPAAIDWRGQPDLFGRTLEVTETGFADEIAAAASLVMGQAAEAMPIALVRGLSWIAPECPAADLVRPAEHDLFR
ncbi:MAG TPA: coenzyme F420-0:L-glutamate ligase [Stellaceae bacterium]|nr:coenzyme F420-0:L-glutamate ligase [Stellaceae bacterium]